MTIVDQQRWLYKLVCFDFIIEYKSGKENGLADALSKRHEKKLGELYAVS